MAEYTDSMSLRHRCDERDCPSFGQRTDKSCGCHQTELQVATKHIKRLAGALRFIVSEFDEYYDGPEHPLHDLVRPIERARAALATVKQEGE